MRHPVKGPGEDPVGAAPDGWTKDDIGDLRGRRALVTGVTSGLGFETALELARHGAEVVLAARNADKLAQTVGRILGQVPGATLTRVIVDLSEQDSVRRAAGRLLQAGEPIHLLVNNAGVMATPQRRTGDGFELQLATNHLGPFALTGLLLPLLADSGDGRVVALSSVAARVARSTPLLGDPRQHTGLYTRWGTYARTKLADLLFTFELDRRLRRAGLPVKALAAHPGVSATALAATGVSGGGSRDGRSRSGPLSAIYDAAQRAVSQPPWMGALPVLMAATADLPGSTYVGPGGVGELQGYPHVVAPPTRARDEAAAHELWEVSERATGVRYP